MGRAAITVHIASFLLAINLGLDSALFFNRKTWDPGGVGRTLHGLVLCSTTTMVAFGVLTLSRIPVLRAIGLTAAFGSLACLLFAALPTEDELHAA